MKNTEASKNVSETPETDMLLSNQFHDCVTYDDAAEQLAELCQKLERERDEARKMLELTWHEDGSPLIQMMRERDEARLQYSTTLVFCQSLVKERLEEIAVNEWRFSR